MLKVVCAYQFSAEQQKVLEEAAGMEVVSVQRTEELVEHLPEAEILCAFMLPKNWKQFSPHLHWLQFPGAGVDGLRPTGILEPDSGILITTAKGIHAIIISEYVFGSLLMFNWNWPRMIRLQERHIWARSASWYNLGGKELAGQTLGIIGLGNIGQRIARLGQAFEMRVLGMRRSASEHGNETMPNINRLYPPERLHEMLPECDYVVLAIPLTPETEKMIGEAELRLMKPSAYLVNVARGKVIDEEALIRALKEGWIAGAGLDVTETEPLPESSPLYSMPNVILTPHIAGASIHYAERLTALFADNLRRYRAGEPLRNRYDPGRGY